MGIIRGRPLFFTALCVTALAVLYLYLRSPVVFILTGILAAALPLPVIALRAGSRIGSYRMFSSILSSLIIAAFCARCGIYYLSAAEAVKKASEPGTVLSGKVVGIRYSTSYSFGCYADLSASSSGDDVVRALVEFQFPAGLRAGDRFFISDFEIADSGFDPDLTADGVFMNVYYHKRLSIDIAAFWKNIARISLGLLPPVAVGVLIVSRVEMSSWWRLGAGIAGYTIIYCLSMWFISMNRNEKQLLIGKLIRH